MKNSPYFDWPGIESTTSQMLQYSFNAFNASVYYSTIDHSTDVVNLYVTFVQYLVGLANYQSYAKRYVQIHNYMQYGVNFMIRLH